MPLVSSPACRLFRLYLLLVIVAREREYGTRSFIIVCVTNRLSPATDIGENSNLEAALFVPARVPRYVSAWDYKSSDRNTYEVKRVCTNKCQIKSRKDEIQTNWQYEANCVLFSRNWINKTPYVYAWKDSGDDCFVNMIGQLVIATRWLITKGSRRYSAEKKEGRAPRRGRDLRERWIKKTWEVWTIH